MLGGLDYMETGNNDDNRFQDVIQESFYKSLQI